MAIANLSSILGMPMVEGENQLPQNTSTLTYTCTHTYTLTHTHTHTHYLHVGYWSPAFFSYKAGQRDQIGEKLSLFMPFFIYFVLSVLPL